MLHGGSMKCEADRKKKVRSNVLFPPLQSEADLKNSVHGIYPRAQIACGNDSTGYCSWFGNASKKLKHGRISQGHSAHPSVICVKGSGLHPTFLASVILQEAFSSTGAAHPFPLKMFLLCITQAQITSIAGCL